MKRILSILIVLLLCLSAFVGCDDEKHISMNDEDIHTEYAGVYLTLTSVDDSGEHKKLKAVWHNETNKEYTFGEDFYIEILENDEWKSVMTEDMIVASIAHVLPAKATQEKTYSTEYFDLSKEGTYRVRCEFSPGDGKRYNTWVSFEITDKTAEKTTYSGEMVIEAINLSSTEATTESQLILDLLNNGEWINDLCKCRCDYQITINGKELNYSSENGAFNNNTDELYLILSDDDKVAVNEYLEKLFEHIDPSEE